MLIERVHGLQATSISLNDRFTILAATAPVARVGRARRGGFLNINNRNVVDQLAYRIGQQNKRRGMQQMNNMPGLRRFGSMNSLPGLRRSNSLGNLSQRSVKQSPWRHSNSNLSRSASFSSLSQGFWRGRGFRRRGGRMGLMRGRMRFRGGHQQLVPRRNTLWANGGTGLRGRPQRGGRSRGAVRGREVLTRQQQAKPIPTKEELDLQLDQYMASTKSALDKELDAYMNNAMEME